MRATLNASFIPSSLQRLFVKNSINKESLFGTNITHLQVKNSETPLTYIPRNLRIFRLVDSSLSTTCEHLQQSKIEPLYIKHYKGSLNMNNTSATTRSVLLAIKC